MFNLFKSPEEKLKQEMFKNVEKVAFLCLKENSMNGSPLEGTILMSYIKNAEDFIEHYSMFSCNRNCCTFII